MTYDWIFGDGSTGAGKMIDHTYPSGGVFTVRLDITDREGDTNRVIKNILVSGTGESRADINRDTYVDLFDIVEITVNFGLTSGFDPPEVDTNDDGEIDTNMTPVYEWHDADIGLVQELEVDPGWEVGIVLIDYQPPTGKELGPRRGTGAAMRWAIRQIEHARRTE